MTMPPTTRNAGRTERPISSASRISIVARMVIIWHRSKAKANRLFKDAPPKTRTIYEPICSLPYEIVEMIIAHLTHDLNALKACSLTCRSLYIVVVQHLHHTLTLGDTKLDKIHDKLKPLSKLHELGLMPLVKEIRVHQKWSSVRPWFVPKAFNHRHLRYFSAFANVQALNFSRLEIYHFIPDMGRYFGHFSPTLRSIVLVHPRCTPRQLSYFLSFFPSLDDVDISSPNPSPNITIPDAELVPLSTPKLGGRLALYDFRWAETWTHFITPPRFHYMDLRTVGGCAPIVLEACAKTLETLRFNVADGLTEPRSFSLLPEFNLSRLEALRSLQIGIWGAAFQPAGPCHPVMEVFSTITSPVFSELVIVLENSQVAYLAWDVAFFETLRMMNQIKPFKLVFLAEVLGWFSVGREEARQRLTGVIDLVTAKGLLNFLGSPPTIRAIQFFDDDGRPAGD